MSRTSRGVVYGLKGPRTPKVVHAPPHQLNRIRHTRRIPGPMQELALHSIARKHMHVTLPEFLIEGIMQMVFHVKRRGSGRHEHEKAPSRHGDGSATLLTRRRSRVSDQHFMQTFGLYIHAVSGRSGVDFEGETRPARGGLTEYRLSFDAGQIKSEREFLPPERQQQQLGCS